MLIRRDWRGGGGRCNPRSNDTIHLPPPPRTLKRGEGGTERINEGLAPKRKTQNAEATVSQRAEPCIQPRRRTKKKARQQNEKTSAENPTHRERFVERRTSCETHVRPTPLDSFPPPWYSEKRGTSLNNGYNFHGRRDEFSEGTSDYLIGTRQPPTQQAIGPTTRTNTLGYAVCLKRTQMQTHTPRQKKTTNDETLFIVCTAFTSNIQDTPNIQHKRTNEHTESGGGGGGLGGGRGHLNS